MIYLDTSFVTPFILPENTSDAVEKFLLSLEDETLAVSHWTHTEFSSLISRKIRMGEIKKVHAEKALSVFEDLIHASFEILAPSASDFILATQFVQRYETHLRAADALHLAISKNHNASSFLTLDENLIKAAKLLHIHVESGIK